MEGTAITATGLSKSFGGKVVLDRIDLEVPRGTVFALLGPNGAGKTTMVHIFSTLINPGGAGRGSAAMTSFVNLTPYERS